MRGVESLRAFVAGAPRDDSHSRRDHVAVFGAGKGGVGTSTVAALTGIVLARAGASVLLVDADETLGSVHMLFGLPAEIPGLGALRAGALSPERLLVPVADGLTLFPGGGGGVAATLAVAASERRMLLRRVAALYDRYDLVVVDGGSRLDSVMAACAAASGRLMAVTGRDPVAQVGAYALLKVARARFGGLPVELLVNRVTPAEARAAHELVDAASATFSGEGVPLAGAVADDAAVVDAGAARGSLAGLPSASPALRDLDPLAGRLVRALAGAEKAAG